MSRTSVIVYASRLQRIGLTCPGAAAEILRAETEEQLSAVWFEHHRSVLLVDQTTGRTLAVWYGPGHALNWIRDPNEATVVQLDQRRARTSRPNLGEVRELQAAAREDLS